MSIDKEPVSYYLKGLEAVQARRDVALSTERRFVVERRVWRQSYIRAYAGCTFTKLPAVAQAVIRRAAPPSSISPPCRMVTKLRSRPWTPT